MSERKAETIKSVSIIVPDVQGELCGVIRTAEGTEYKVWPEARFGGERWDPKTSTRALRDMISRCLLKNEDLWLRDPFFGHDYALTPLALEQVVQVGTTVIPMQDKKPIRERPGIDIIRDPGILAPGPGRR